MYMAPALSVKRNKFKHAYLEDLYIPSLEYPYGGGQAYSGYLFYFHKWTKEGVGRGLSLKCE